MSLASHSLAGFRSGRVVPWGLLSWSKPPVHARAFGHPVPRSGSCARRPVALPRSRVTPLDACPALRPRWCPRHSPLRVEDCCLPATGNRRLSLATPLRAILLSTTIRISGLHHAACLRATPGSVHPLATMHAGSLRTCWLGWGQVGLEPSSVLTHWVTTTNFMGFLPIPRSRASLGATSA